MVIGILWHVRFELAIQTKEEKCLLLSLFELGHVDTPRRCYVVN